ncbi:excinuclease ABC subunit UvrA [Faecalibacillus intestinalis]|jgi:excinuclease ABC subunit A|uniref:UvrABC system protein A n=1 Tax=Faecalibacillus intestinalis TaxID=1982626 RepID=A0AAP2XNR7_9FIRM|nr:excinuclease ABC subunit UvrA [Faecalibacillus intestinalis]MCB8593493.1 excinuclease ABC subunit UvrA [Faecalibacillus intestinalis]MCB8613982.1 excinuclease ABC subunit UvrA [Faecalibacillus intestinalis]MCG4682099.1 excinuclease ABC subunit UvrA [Faecalibacillus intestinalis]MCG4714937.1 excinuclease ABC subunit UvrA [Faecalibacillus intestinalis]MCG4756166.1 excinuclease ABC subunit UvrA [Faecalibacillus intestinalis]
MEDKLIIRGARENNLKNINIDIPKNKLVIMTGLSGSGKTSLAFDTIYAEGQRRYVESLSAYARQFLGNMEKPDVDAIEGLSPAIAIDQKTTSNNPRSTVGTVTEIYDYLRLLYARVGKAYCPKHDVVIESQTIKQMADTIDQYADGDRLMVVARVVKRKKGTFKDYFADLLKDGYLRVVVDGQNYMLDEEIELDKNKKHDIDVVIDRIIKKEGYRSRLVDSLEVGLKLTGGEVIVQNLTTKTEELFSEHLACPICGFSVPKLEPRLFSFNNPLGACPDCRGLGIKNEVDDDLLIPDWSKSINEGGLRYFKTAVGTNRIEWQRFLVLCKKYKIDLDKPLKDFTKQELSYILDGSREPISYEIVSDSGNVSRTTKFIEGVRTLIARRYEETTSKWSKEWYASFMSEHTCPTCKGRRLNDQVLSVRVGGLNIAEFTEQSIGDALHFIQNIKLTDYEMNIARLVVKEINDRLTFLNNVGLGYLTLARRAGGLSGGEAQRIRLATQIGTRLTGVLYVLDEPSIGLHQRDNEKLIKSLQDIRDLGNSVLVVEHDEDTMRASDFIVDIGPGAGVHGGQVICAGTPEEVMNCKDSITGQYLSGNRKIEVPQKRRKGNGLFIEVKGAKEHNLKNINVKFPLGKFNVVTGVSGSGKSTLVNDILGKSLMRYVYQSKERPGLHKEILGIENIDKVIEVSQDPIGRTPRSNPVTYTGVFDDIRDLFAQTNEAKMRGYDKGRFSFNVKGGRCEACQGDGLKKISMHFLPDVYVPCEQCEGKRYNEETLQVTYKDKNIYDVLEMTVEEALDFFDNLPKIRNKIQTLYDVGLGYIKLGQSATTLSGGEAQRVKLASELQKKSTGKTVYILDEPTTGLHSHDVARLIDVLQRIVDQGDTIIVIEHNLDVIKVADHIIDLGPEGGAGGGTIVVTGTPEKVAKCEKSYTGQFLKSML